jgi:hypothetical protein
MLKRPWQLLTEHTTAMRNGAFSNVELLLQKGGLALFPASP